MLSGWRGMLIMLTLLPNVTAAFNIDLPIETPAGAAVTAVVMTLVTVSILSYFYQRLKAQSGGAAG